MKSSVIGSTYICLLFLTACHPSEGGGRADAPAPAVRPSRCEQELTETERAALAEGAHRKRHQVSTQISKEEAVSIANEHFIKSGQILDGVNVVVCETVDFWHINYTGAGLEYFVSKYYKLEPLRYEVREGATVGTGRRNQACKPSKISRQEAIEIARSAYEKLLVARGDTKPTAAATVERYNAFACELTDVWRIIFEYRELPGQEPPNAHPPFYTISKETGMIIQEQPTG
jgi:hypothetical protein